MRKRQFFKTLLILAVIIWALYELYPTYKLHTLTAEERARLEAEGKLADLEFQAIKMGLDLQGGIYLVLEADLPQLLTELAKNKDNRFTEILEETKKEMATSREDFFTILQRNFRKRNLHLNKYFGSRTDSDQKIIKRLKKEAQDAISRSLEILRNRVDQFGVSEPSLQRRGDRRIVVELPGIQDIGRAKALIGKTALLEFKLLKDEQVLSDVLNKINRALKRERREGVEDTSEVKKTPEEEISKEKGKPSKDKIINIEELFGKGSLEVSQEGTPEVDTTVVVDEQMFSKNPFFALLRNLGRGRMGAPKRNINAINRILDRAEIKKLIPPDAQFLWSSKPIIIGGEEYYELYLVNKEPELTGKYISDADVQIGGGQMTSGGAPVVSLSLNRRGARIFSRVTGANVGEFLAIVLDGKVASAPRIREKIPTGNAIIEGMANMDEAKDLAIVLRAGALPAPVEIIEDRSVGPSLGRDSIDKGKWSALIGLLLVMLFMVIYYKMSGVIADLALILNLIILLGVLAGFHFTLTLPGIAGIILTIGMAVDANVLIFERIREELGTGKTIRASIDTGYSRAFKTILDANVTTLITAVVLYQFGTGPIRGFALTLSIGIIASMFTAIIVTRTIFDYITQRFALKTLSI